MIVGIVPARGGSKGIPRKNLARLAGRPLLAYTCEAARATRALDRVLLSTDDPEIADAGRALGLDVPFLRPATLSADDTPMVAVLRHAVDALTSAHAAPPDAIVLLQPTSPLRRAEHIDEAVAQWRASGADTVVSVVEVPHQFTPASLFRLEAGRLRPAVDGPLLTRRQDKPVLYARNGPAVVVVRTRILMDEGTLYGRDCRAFVMSPEDSIDVDGPWDLELAEFVLSRRAASIGRP
jgi:CMP-N-acetylneuraminic acid synthetase